MGLVDYQKQKEIKEQSERGAIASEALKTVMHRLLEEAKETNKLLAQILAKP